MLKKCNKTLINPDKVSYEKIPVEDVKSWKDTKTFVEEVKHGRLLTLLEIQSYLYYHEFKS